MDMRIGTSNLQSLQQPLPAFQAPTFLPANGNGLVLPPIPQDSINLSGSYFNMEQLFSAQAGTVVGEILADMNEAFEIPGATENASLNGDANAFSSLDGRQLSIDGVLGAESLSKNNTMNGVQLDMGAGIEGAAAAGAAAADQIMQDIQANNAQSELVQLLQMLVQLLTGQSGGITALPDGAFASVAGGGAPSMNSLLQAQMSSVQRRSDDGEAINTRGNQELQNSLDQIESDPVGSILLAKARENGVTIRVGDTGGDNILGFFRPSTNEIVVGDGANIKTIVHELGHAATREDGNSQEEEGIVEAIGRDVVSRLSGNGSLSNDELQSIANQKRTLYRDLGTNNDIKESLARLGISVGIT